MRNFLLTVISSLVTVSISFAGPPSPDPITVTQPDGSTFAAKVRGDEFQRWVEAVDSGHTVIRNKDTGAWEYAEKMPDGTLQPTGMAVDPTGQFAPWFLEKNVAPDRDLVREAQHNALLQQSFEELKSSSSDSPFVPSLSGAMFAAGDWTPQPISGSKKMLIILVSFNDKTITTTPTAWYDSVFSTTPGVKSVANFYNDNSFGAFTVTPVAHTQAGNPAGVVSVTVNRNHPYNVPPSGDGDYADEQAWITPAINAAAAYVNFNALDTNSNGTITGSEMGLYFVVAGYEQSGSAKTPSIWAHAWGPATGGGKTFANYALNGELNNADLQHPMGVIAHEMGHQLCGLPDLYDTANPTVNAGMGNFSLMAGGSWGRTSSEYGGATPTALDAWSRQYLGWTAPQTPAANGAVSLGAALASANNAVKLSNSSSSTEYWLAENRHPIGWDQGLTGLISGYAGGLLITHIDITVGTSGVGSTGNNDINRFVAGQHQGVVPEQASTSLCNMLTTTCRGAANTTFYSGNKAAFGAATTPDSNYYNGSASNFEISGISARGATMTATVKVAADELSPPTVTAFAIPATSASLTVPITSFTATGANTVNGYLVTETSPPPAAGDSRWSAAKPSSYTFASAGVKTLYAWARDNQNNVSASRSASVTINLEGEPPTVTAFSIPRTSSSLVVPVSTFTATDNAGVTGYLITETSGAPGASDSRWSASKPANYTFLTQGAKILYAWAKDGADNVSISRSAAVTITLTDTVSPVISALTLASSPYKSRTVPLTITATDNVAVTGYYLSQVSATPLAGAGGWISARPSSYTFDADGQKTLYAWAKDAAGHVSAMKSAVVKIDTTLPLVTGFAVPAVSKALTVPVTTFTANDETGLAGYLITTTATVPAATLTTWGATKPTSFTAPSTGLKTLYAWVKDKAGNVSAAATATVNIDMTAPVVTAFAVPALVNSTTVPVTRLTATDNTRVTGYLITTTATTPAATLAAWSADAPATVTVSAGIGKTLYAWAKDAAGNVSLARTATLTVDTTKPQVTAFTLPALVKTLTVPVSALTATDNVAVAKYLVTGSSDIPAGDDTGWRSTAPASYICTTPGVNTLYAWAKDTAGNISLAKSATVKIDTTLPVVTGFAVPAVAKSLTVPVTSFTANDEIGLAGYLITTTATVPAGSLTTWSTTKPASFTAPSTGLKTLYAWVKDKAGNVSAAATATVNVDMSAPVVTAFTVPALVNTTSVPVTKLTATDNTGVTGYLITTTDATPAATLPGWSASPPESYTTTPGTKTLYAWARDLAGNVSLARTTVTTIDTTKPIVGTFTMPSLSKSLTVSGIAITASDNIAVAAYQITASATPPAATDVNWKTVKPTSFIFPGDTTPGVKTLYAWARDLAGNVSPAKSATIKIDMTLPLVTGFAVPAVTKSLTVPVTTFAASDDIGLGGYLITTTAATPAATLATWSTTKPTSFTVPSTGLKTLYAWVKDTAGNVSASATATVNVDMTVPVVTAITVPALVNNTTVPVDKLTATDNTGVTGYLITTTAATPTATLATWSVDVPETVTVAAGIGKTLYAWARDAAGNVSLAKAATVTVDTVKPVVTTLALPTLVRTLTVPVNTFTATDNVAVAQYLITESSAIPEPANARWSNRIPASYTASGAGRKTLYAWAKDKAGNVSLGKLAAVEIQL